MLCDGAVARYLGLVATMLECFDDGDRHFTDARAINERIGARIFVTATQVDQAALLRRGGRGDAARADTLPATVAAISSCPQAARLPRTVAVRSLTGA